MAIHSKRPSRTQQGPCTIGRNLFSRKTGVPLVEQYHFLRDWWQHGQIYTYSGPGWCQYSVNANYPNPNYTHTEDCIYRPIMYTPEQTNSGDRYLAATLLPWCYAPNGSGRDPEVEWTPPGGAAQTMWTSTGTYPPDLATNGAWSYRRIGGGTMSSGRGPTLDSMIEIYKDDTNYMSYTPSATGWQYGKLETSSIMVAALSIWDMPYNTLSDAEARILPGDVAAGRGVIGYEAAPPHKSVGDLCLERAGGALDDYVETMTRRCLFQSGHPLGLQTSTSGSYVNIRGAESSAFIVSPRNLLSQSGTVACLPACVVSATGATGVNKGYVKFTSRTGADTWILEITSNTEALYKNTDGTTSTLDIAIDSTAGDNYDAFYVELKAPPSGTITLYTWSLWEPSYMIY